MRSQTEFTMVKSPFIYHLICMRWQLVTDNLAQPSVTERETFREDLLACRTQVTCLLTEGAA